LTTLHSPPRDLTLFQQPPSPPTLPIQVLPDGESTITSNIVQIEAAQPAVGI
jgi:hypothetical protein